LNWLQHNKHSRHIFGVHANIIIAAIAIIIVQAIVNVGLLFAWRCMCLMNTPDDHDLLEKVVNITNVHEYNDVTMSIKVQQSRSWYAKYVYYNCTQQEMKSIA